MDSLPDELTLYILSFLEPQDLIAVQSVSKRFLPFGRDSNLWKRSCFHFSRAETLRRRQLLLSAQDENLAALRRAFEEARFSNMRQAFVDSVTDDTEAPGLPKPTPLEKSRHRAIANWDPAYPGENVDFYQEYIHRHAPLSIRWLRSVQSDSSNGTNVHESMGVGLIDYASESLPTRAVAPMDDGSICIWDIGYSHGWGHKFGTIVARTKPGVLFDAVNQSRPLSHMIGETTAVDNVSVDAAQEKAYIAYMNELNEVDLRTLQIIRRQPYPFDISVLSEAKRPTPLTIGTHSTLHLYDTRVGRQVVENGANMTSELIGGMLPPSDRVSFRISTAHVTLSEPRPLSIVQPAYTDSIWVAGRFTSLLEYDRRFWPKIQSTFFSGARLSSLAYLPFPYVPRCFDLVKHPDVSLGELHHAKSAHGSTLVAVGEYKGKGSLELYGLPQVPAYPFSEKANLYRNRQTASKSRLLSVAPHGAKLVFSDGDGNLKWVERDGTSLVRSFNINADVPNAPLTPVESSLFHQPDAAEADQNSDIVQKIIPLSTRDDSSSTRRRVNNEDLLIWTGDGRLGVVGFGPQKSRFDRHDESREATEREAELEEAEKERQYGQRMREALERQADEARFVQGLGLGYGMGGHMGMGW